MKMFFRIPLVASAIVPFVVALTLAQSDAPKNGAKPDAKAADKGDAKAPKPRAKPRGRLPAYYSQVVDGQQREKIYKIQQDYEPKISELKAQLQALQDKLDAEVEAVLRPDQLTKVKELTDAAKQKRKASASATASATTESSSSTDSDSSSDTDSDDDDADKAVDAKAAASKSEK
jgi:hypothetical protein